MLTGHTALRMLAIFNKSPALATALTYALSMFVQIVSASFSPTARCQSRVTFQIYACPNNNQRYTDAAGMRSLARMTVHIDDPAAVDPPDLYKLTLTFKLGGTEIQAFAMDDQTGKMARTSVVFVSD